MIDLMRVGAGGARACDEARDWRKKNACLSDEQAWDACERADWLIWIASKAGIGKPKLVRCAFLLARDTLHLVRPGEDRPRQALDLVERWLADPASVTRPQLRSAAAAAYAAAAANAADAADAAAYAAAYADAAARAADASLYRNNKRQADIVRSVISFEEVLNGLEVSE